MAAHFVNSAHKRRQTKINCDIDILRRAVAAYKCKDKTLKRDTAYNRRVLKKNF